MDASDLSGNSSKKYAYGDPDYVHDSQVLFPKKISQFRYFVVPKLRIFFIYR